MTTWTKQPHYERCRSEEAFSDGLCDCGKEDRDALIDELTEARTKLSSFVDPSLFQETLTLRDELLQVRQERDAVQTALAHARAAAFEEAARWCDGRAARVLEIYFRDPVDSRNEDGTPFRECDPEAWEEWYAYHAAAAEFRALSATPATVVCVPVPTFERVKTQLLMEVIHASRGISFHAPDGEEPNLAAHEGFSRIEEGCKAVLAEMSKVKP